MPIMVMMMMICSSEASQRDRGGQRVTGPLHARVTVCLVEFLMFEWNVACLKFEMCNLQRVFVIWNVFSCMGVFPCVLPLHFKPSVMSQREFIPTYWYFFFFGQIGEATTKQHIEQETVQIQSV